MSALVVQHGSKCAGNGIEFGVVFYHNILCLCVGFGGDISFRI